MDILRFITAGNIDDGKSTLTGRLLLDTGNIKSDILQTVTSGDDEVNLAHIADGLRSEREQGITIDVAYKYFTAGQRKFIITDAPGHFQYTRNLVTGASNADVIIVLIDAKNGITAQTKRHSMVAAFLGIKHVLVAVNKMDAVGYDLRVFEAIAEQYTTIAGKLGLNDVTIVPVSALKGDNVSSLSGKMKWYAGPSILDYLQRIQPYRAVFDELRFAVQHITGAGEDKIVVGKLLSGNVARNSEIMVWPQQKVLRVTQLFTGNCEADKAIAGQNVNISLDNMDDIKRGSMITPVNTTVKCSRHFKANICWLDDTVHLQEGMTYILRMNTRVTTCTIKEVISVTDPDSFDQATSATPIAANDFAAVIIATADEVIFDPFADLPANGRGILIDTATNATLAALTITDAR